jgi:hypothetical protein
VNLSAAIILAMAMQAPPTRAVEVRWDLDPSHDGVTTWEIEADGVVASCTEVAVMDTYRRCTWLAEARPYAAIRLRGVRDVCVAIDGRVLAPCPGAWSAPIAADLSGVPGVLTIRRVLPGE